MLVFGCEVTFGLQILMEDLYVNANFAFTFL